MRYYRCVFIILLQFLFLINLGVEVSAMNTGFSTESLAEDDVETVLKNINISTLTDEPPKKSIECFAVNEKGLVAIGCSTFENKTVCIYTSDGCFQYGFNFESNGSFGVDFYENVLIVYLVRSDVAIAVNSNGEIEGVLKIQNTSENTAYWNDFVFSTRRKIGNTEYTLENNMGIFNVFASSYSRLVITNQNGETNIVYDVNSAQFLKMLVVFIGVLVFVCLVVVVVIQQFIELKREKR